jgi:protoheme IX farnesyltransferase
MISVSVTYSSFAGYVIANHKIDFQIITLLLGVYILSSGASTFNQIAERKTDALMTRTQNRPIPAGRISLKIAVIFALIMSVSGSLILFLSFGWLVTLLGVFNLLWYNLVYTPLKKITVWAVFVGTITGVIPFYMGYLSVISDFPEHSAHFIAVFLLLWQIPHFFLLLGIYGKEYEMAGLASVTKRTSEVNLFKLSAIWIIAICIISIFLPMFHINHYKISGYFILGISGFVILMTVSSQILTFIKKFKLLFIVSNIMQLAIITCLILDSLL